ncbi:DegT/DnrJ/EryC1/StrS family aminotransferase [Neptunicella sp.]|uniref:DegT/DnrJ/EryC1/StrS family aminotransferase n=1 Tax=Neptunicella sp. TaxID=2125986 RepID=UPI003F68C467
MEVLFPPTIANANDFPEVIIKASPKFQFRKLDFRASLKKSSHILLTRNGRGAMGIAGQKLQYTDRKNIVLIPAYHCPALVEPFIWLNYEIRFYPLLPDLSVDIEQLKNILKDDVTHCVVIRYFGFAQNIQQVINTVQQKNILVIEDCAHALFDFLGISHPLNTQSDAKICSINKLLPSIDGGALYFKKISFPRVSYCTWLEEIKGIMFLVGVIPLVNKIRKKFNRGSKRVPEVNVLKKAESKNLPSLTYFSEKDLTSSGFRHTELILRHSCIDKIIQKRQENFTYLVNHLVNSDIGKPLYNKVHHSVPYVVPFLLKHEKYFAELRKKGIQILRWEEVAISDCEVSQDYRKRLIQLPCHQQLLKSELDIIIQAITSLECQ